MRALFAAAAVAFFAVAGCAPRHADTTIPLTPGAEMTNKAKAVALLHTLKTGDTEAVGYINPDKYIQHNLDAADGPEGFAALLTLRPPEGFGVNVVRAFEDGDYVFTHTEYEFFGPKIGFDLFRFEDGLIVEHWDNLIEARPPNPSGHTQIDGPTAATGLEQTATNKALVRDFYESVLVGGQMDRLPEFFDGDRYTQHNPDIADGISGLGAAIAAMAEQGVSMEFHTIHRVLGEGDFVLVVAEGAFGGAPYAYYDLFRVEAGKIAEHWDVMAPIPPRESWKNDNGKF